MEKTNKTWHCLCQHNTMYGLYERTQVSLTGIYVKQVNYANWCRLEGHQKAARLLVNVRLFIEFKIITAFRYGFAARKKKKNKNKGEKKYFRILFMRTFVTPHDRTYTF